MNLKLSAIEITDLQARAGTDDKTIDEYAEAWKSGESFPKIICFHDGKNYFLADGFHRYFGAKKAGLKEIPADVRKGSRSDALWFAAGANKTHGLKRTNEDKRRAVELALKEKPDSSDRVIAEHVGVGPHLVADVRLQVCVRTPDHSKPPEKRINASGQVNLKSTSAHPPVPEKRIGRDGKSYPAPPSRPPSKPPERPSSPPPNAKRNPPLPSAPAKKDEPKTLDKTGYPIPAKILPLWNRGHEAQDVLNSISGIRSMLRHAQDDKDLLFREVNFSSVLAHLDQAYSDCKTAVPYAVCTCEGHHPEDCTFCKGRGFLSEHRYKTCATKEIKEMREKLTKK